MTADQRLLAIFAGVNSALYLAGVFVAGLVLGNHGAVYAVIATAGVTFLSYVFQLGWGEKRKACVVVSLATIVAGAASGILLLIG